MLAGTLKSCFYCHCGIRRYRKNTFLGWGHHQFSKWPLKGHSVQFISVRIIFSCSGRFNGFI
jgi:hypothetical protein